MIMKTEKFRHVTPDEPTRYYKEFTDDVIEIKVSWEAGTTKDVIRRGVIDLVADFDKLFKDMKDE